MIVAAGLFTIQSFFYMTRDPYIYDVFVLLAAISLIAILTLTLLRKRLNNVVYFLPAFLMLIGTIFETLTWGGMFTGLAGGWLLFWLSYVMRVWGEVLAFIMISMWLNLKSQDAKLNNNSKNPDSSIS